MKKPRISVSFADDRRVVFHIPVHPSLIADAADGKRCTVVFSLSRRQLESVLRKTSPEAMKRKTAKRGK